MKAKIINYTGYRYTAKNTGEMKEGKAITVMELTEFKQDDNRGNFSYGFSITENIRLTGKLLEDLNHYDIVDLVGKEVELTFARAPGQKYETLVEILPL